MLRKYTTQKRGAFHIISALENQMHNHDVFFILLICHRDNNKNAMKTRSTGRFLKDIEKKRKNRLFLALF